ncbi:MULTISPECIES: TetR/AcrR family transcriptional regulator [Streptomyces]|uniref:TetR family transcriptional regulator n=4 Tax=Streptomyces TaxID=1883 RepID=A0A8H9HR98_9ACTN|nr:MULTISPECIES: TetR/AcrR family transcriptional regulator [Streptomyces]NEE36935.1 TetR/AcrR family transcriptional regulator [Streptomyces sp. SID7982]NEE55279.1 TetR/AcrR family transcriptional regulator [Streptomyces sp. SID8455]MBL3807661.1 TetR/AcrR family transcriptional regulator [Streptomyces sp. BRB081]MDQ0296792.1 AcrR family transcriptional regulator [Streptomyces sp. DSM 41037]NEC11893.1 TetR/AcrR family transcriptional regulator [Streptomyces sp. SID8014]
MARSERSRTALLDAAERLFAEGGIAQTSDRRIAEAAGNTNHSAVGYYFGGREGLLRTLLTRHITGLEPARREMSAASGSLLGDVRSLVVPATDALVELAEQAGEGRPTWRARFVRAALHDPQAAEILRGLGGEAPVAAQVVHSIVARLDHLPANIVRGRAALMTHIITSTCAENEERAARGATDPRWRATGDFLSDAITGMLLAPVSQGSRDLP